MKHYGDVSKIDGAEVEPVDVITFGSPCQDLSVAGKRAGIQDGERSNLFFEAIRIIKEMREATNGEYPKYAVWENVPGAFSSNKGHDFHAVLEALCSVCDSTVSIPRPYDAKRTKLVWNKAGEIVGDNYSIAWRTLDAQYWGVPQRRKRIYLVADFTGRCAGEILFVETRLRRDMQTGNETWKGSTADIVGGVDGSNGNGGQLAATLISSYGTKWNGNAGAYNGENFVLQKHSVDGSVGAAGVVSKGNGECFIMPERHMSLSVGGGQAGQGYPCVLHRSVGVEYCCSMITGQQLYAWEDMANPLKARDYKDPAIVAYSFDSLSSNSMKSSNPFSGCRAVEVAKCIDTTYPDPSKNQGGVAVVQPLCLKERAGCDGGGKGALWSDKAFTLAVSQDMSVCVLNDQGGSSINIESEELSPTLRANSHQHEPVIAFTQNQREEVRDLGNKAGALAAEAGVHQQTYVAQPVVALQANGIDRADTVDRHAVCYQGQVGALQARDYKGIGSQYVGEDKLVVECYDARGNGDGETACTITGDHQNRITDYTAVACFQNTGRGWWNESEVAATVRTACGGDSVKANLAVSIGNGQLNQISMTEQSNTIDCMHDKQAVLTDAKPPRRYIIRRLTPVECARLQGFPDKWGHLAPYNPADAEFWEEVRKTHAEINGKKYKPVKNLKKWYNKLHNDGAEYKAYGNGLALPCAEYVIHGIAEQGAKTLGSLFDGIGGFPLAGVLNGIKPVWASEIEPYPIAVTKSRFKEVHNG